MRFVRFTLFAFWFLLPISPAELDKPNSDEQRNKPYLLLIGIDGLRHDALERFQPKNLMALRDAGSHAERLVPSYPSTTFPNFYTIVTGLRPERHRIVSMRFFSPASGKEFYYRRNSTEGEWFGGTPLWVLAERQGMRSASFFWVGSETEIQGIRPSAWRPYDVKVSHQERIDQVARWLTLPEDVRPHAVFLYFADVDSTSHNFGPESSEAREALLEVDESLGQLFAKLESARLDLNIVVVSDHGQKECPGMLDLGKEVDLTGFKIINDMPLMFYSKDAALVDRTYNQLRKQARGRYRVYRKRDVPAYLQYSNSSRIGDLVVLSGSIEYVFAWTKDTPPPRPDFKPQRGCHGLDPYRVPEMHGVFLAKGPQIRPGVRLGKLDNVDIFPLLIRILGLTPPEGTPRTNDLVKRLYKP
jgi:predicted AlkP superfamily pyrophosphatase or phosphodiesterase